MENLNSGNFIEIIGDFSSDHTLTLKPGTSGGLRFNGGSVTLTGDFSVSTPVIIGDGGNTAEVTPNSAGSIKAANIYINNTVKATDSGTNDLTLEANTPAGTINITGAVGESTKYLGDIKVVTGAVDFDEAVSAKSYTQAAGSANFDSTQNYNGTNGSGFQFNGTTLHAAGDFTTTEAIRIDSGVVDFDAAVTAKSYTQAAGSANFDGTQDYSRVNSSGNAFEFNGSTLTVNHTLATSSAANGGVGGKILINAGTAFTTAAAGVISSGGAFEKTGAGNSSLLANISTTNTTAANASITFNDAPVTINPGDNSTLSLDSSAGNGAINIAGAVSSTGANRSFTLNSGDGIVTLSNTGAPAINLRGSFTKTGGGQSRLSGGITTTNNNISFAGPVELYNNIALDSGSGGGNISLQRVDGNSSSTAYDLALAAGTGNITVGGVIGDDGTSLTGTDRLDVLKVISAANAIFSDSIWAASFDQSDTAGTGSGGSGLTEFTGNQNYTGGFKFIGTNLTVNNTLQTDTDNSGDGAIAVTVSGSGTPLFTVGTSGDIRPGGPGGTITVDGNTFNSGTITAGPVVASTGSPALAITFNGDYNGDNGTYGDDIAGKLNGTSTDAGGVFNNPDIVFRANVELGSFTHNGDIVVFDGAAGTGHALKQDPALVDFDVSPRQALGAVLVRAGNTVTPGTDISQDSAPGSASPPVPARSLELGKETVSGAGDGGILKIVPPLTWRMGAAANPAAGFDPAFVRGFYGHHGKLLMNSGSRLETEDFYTAPDDSAAPPHEHRVEFSSTAGEMSGIVASGNVIINESFVNPEQSRLAMTGDGRIIMTRAQVETGSFSVGLSGGTETVTIGSDMIFRGDLTIHSGRTLKAGAAAGSAYLIRVEGDWIQWTGNWNDFGANSNSDPLPAYSGDMGIFTPQQSTVEFGIWSGRPAGTPAPRTFEIIGNTTWYNFICNEPRATLLFSNYPHQHTVTGKFVVQPVSNASGAILEDKDYMIKLDRIVEVKNPSPPALAPPVPDFVPAVGPEPWVAPLEPNKYFWYFNLESRGELDMNYASVFFSFSNRRVPLPPPPVSSWRIDASPYVEMILPTPPDTKYVPNYTVGLMYKSEENGSYYNVNWYVANQFFYSFTEDSDGNGRIDRLRLQSAFELLDRYPAGDPRFPNQDAFEGFEIAVEGYEIDRSRGRNGYARADMGTDAPDKLDSIYVFLREKDHNDGGDRLRWKITGNTYLRDLTTRSVLVGEPDDEGVAWDTTPPRINYALTIPGSDRKEIFFQTSEAVNTDRLEIESADTENIRTFSAPSPLKLEGDGAASEFLIPLSDSYGVADLVKTETSFPRFHLKGVEDLALVAPDLHFSNLAYNYRYPSPRYPYNFDYDAYVFVQNGTPVKTWAKRPGDSSPVELDRVVCGAYEPDPSADLQPEVYQPKGHANRLNSPRFDPALRPSTPDSTLGERKHRVTDTYISVPPRNASDTDKIFIWPVWARYREPSNPSTISPVVLGERDTDNGIIWDFTGIKFLEERDAVLQARLNPDLAGVPDLFLGLGAGTDYRNPGELKGRAKGTGGLWLPGEANYSPASSVPVNYINLVPRWFGAAKRAPLSLPSPQPPLFNYGFSRDLPGYDSGAKVDFLFRLDNSPQDIFAGRLALDAGVSSIPADWYRLVRPFSFDLQDVTLQRGGVTILNNVINPNDGESAYIRYHLLKSGRVTVQVFSLDGSLVKTLRRNDHREAGEWTDAWNGKNNGSRAVARGMYFVRVVAPDIDEIRKIMVVK
ncbi:MAG: hypothetical protein LBP27_02285 [Treponema sp.]|nr:hypothetical protein [Treponema sp.]